MNKTTYLLFVSKYTTLCHIKRTYVVIVIDSKIPALLFTDFLVT